jgi:hypothetical protein
MLHSFLQRLFVSNISWLQDWLQDGPFWF